MDQASNSATPEGGLEELSVKVNVSYFAFLEPIARSNKTIVFSYIPTTKSILKDKLCFSTLARVG